MSADTQVLLMSHDSRRPTAGLVKITRLAYVPSAPAQVDGGTICEALQIWARVCT